MPGRSRGETGETITEAILKSLEERLMRLRGRRTAGDLAQDVRKIGDRFAELRDLDTRNPDQILGYGSGGAPA